MRRQKGVKSIRHKEVYVLRIGLIHVYHLIYFYYLLCCITHVLLLDKLGDLLLYLSLGIYIVSQLSYYICVRV